LNGIILHPMTLSSTLLKYSIVFHRDATVKHTHAHTAGNQRGVSLYTDSVRHQTQNHTRQLSRFNVP